MVKEIGEKITSLTFDKKFTPKMFFNLFKDIPKNLSDTENKTRMLLSIFPFLDRLLFNNRDKEELSKIWTFLEDLGNQLKNVEDGKIDNEFLQTPEFYYLLKGILEKLRFEFKQEKIKLFRNFLLNSLITDKNKKIDVYYFLNKINNLDLEHFQIIDWYYNNKYTSSNRIGSEYDSKKLDELSKISRYYASLEVDLQNTGFLRLIMVEAENNRYVLNHLGQQFFEFIKYDEKVDDK